MVSTRRISHTHPRRGRPRVVELTPEEGQSLAQIMSVANVGRDAISATMATWVWAEEHKPELLEVLRSRSSKHSLPVAVREVARRVRGIIPAARDSRRVREVGVLTGGMRLGLDGSRLKGWERFSFDDVTKNHACYVPWPQGGDRCSDRYGVRVGRWQTLAANSCGTRYTPLFLSAVRWHQTYTGEDASVIANALPRTVCLPKWFVLEGGVWQGPRMEAIRAALGIGLVSSKGRPNQKLIENWFHTFHTRLSIELKGMGALGRFRGEEKAWSEVYLACRDGRKDPREWFISHEEMQIAVERAITWMNRNPTESRVYGKWIPEERWALDMESLPPEHQPVTEEQVPEWTTAPVLATRTVRRGSVTVAAAGPDGESLSHTFCAPELVEWTGQQVRVAFDPFCIDAGATIVEARQPRIICQATFTGATAGKAAVDAIAALRAGVRRELRVLLPNQPTRREILIRQPAADPAPARRETTAPAPRTTRSTTPLLEEESEEQLLARLRAAEADLRALGHYVPAPL